MKNYKMCVTEVRHGEVTVKANSLEEAKMLVVSTPVDYYEEEPLIINKVLSNDGEPIEDEMDDERTFVVTEYCSECETEVEMRWDTDTMGFMAFCPHCGKRLMLCDECRHAGCGPCDYDSKTDTCRFNHSK